jgi:peptidoglycan/LPS O-acetylase OafA/YrhL
MTSSPESPDRIASLDGLRALSILLVLTAHVPGTVGAPGAPWVFRLFDLGNMGVRVFFVISGYLITGLLLREQERSGTISIPRFYFRRTLRIFPAYYVFLACVAVAAAHGVEELRPHDMLHAVTYTENYNADHSWVIGHAWSLSVEEQFYLMWPAVLLLSGARLGMWIAAGFAAAVPLVRVAVYYFAPAWYPRTGYTFETVGDAIAIGCLLAGLRSQLWNLPRYRALLGSAWFWVVPAAVFAISSAARPRLQGLFGITLMNVGVALCIDWAIRNADGVVGRVLNCAPLVLIGQWSYSLYLWQQPFLDRASTTWWTRFPLNVGLAFTAALASYYLVERPCLNARKRIEVWWRRSRPDAAEPPAGTVAEGFR